VIEAAVSRGWELTQRTKEGRYEAECKLMFQRQVWMRSFTGCNRRVYHTEYCAGA